MGFLNRLWSFLHDGPFQLRGPDYHHFRRIIIPTSRGGQNPEQLSERARHTLGGMAHLIAFGLIKRVSYAVGSPDLTETYEKLLTETPDVAVMLVDTSIKLDHSAALPETEIRAVLERVHRSQFTLSLLQHLVVQRFYLFPSDYKVRQRLCQQLGIAYKPVQTQDPRQKVIGPAKDEGGA